MEAFPCCICGEGGHRVGRCNELWQNKTPPPQKGEHGDDEDDHLRIIGTIGRKITISGNVIAQDFNQTNGSNAGH